MALFANYLRTISRISRKSKFILMLRDYPSLLLGHYNFWCHPFLDGTCYAGEWYTPGGGGAERECRGAGAQGCSSIGAWKRGGTEHNSDRRWREGGRGEGMWVAGTVTGATWG